MITHTHHRPLRGRRTRYLWASSRFAVRLFGVILASYCLTVLVLPRQFIVGSIEVMGVSVREPIYESFVDFLAETQHLLGGVVGVGYVELLVAVFVVGVVLELFDRTDLLDAVETW